MGYEEKDGSFVQYEGQSFIRSLSKDSGASWTNSEHGVFDLTDTGNVSISKGELTKSVDSKALVLILGTSITSGLSGLHRLRVYAKDSANAEINEVIADYRINYINGKATSEKKR